MSIETMKLALEALEDLQVYPACYIHENIDKIPKAQAKEEFDQSEKAITALRAAIEQAESQEPVAWGIANTRPTEKNPLMTVMLDKPEPSHLVVPLYPAPPQHLLDEAKEQGRKEERALWEMARLGQEIEQEPVATLFGSLPVYDVAHKQNPVAWRTFDGEGGYEYRDYDMNEDYDELWAQRNPNHKGWVEPLYSDPTPCQTCEALARTVMMDQTSHDTAPPQRDWRWLTDEEIYEAVETSNSVLVIDMAHAIE
ncbi:MAG: hypothetical protein ACR2JS_09695, partial [Candidatus Nanopelagicales bacterium]